MIAIGSTKLPVAPWIFTGEAMKQNVATHEKVMDILTLDREAQKEVVNAISSIETEIRAHDLRSQKIYTTALRAVDKLEAHMPHINDGMSFDELTMRVAGKLPVYREENA